MGGDSDSNAAVLGQLAGAFYGIRTKNGIPQEWIIVIDKNSNKKINEKIELLL